MIPPGGRCARELALRVNSVAHQHDHGFAVGNRRGILAHADHAIALARKTIDLVLMFLLGVAANENIGRGILVVNFAGGGHKSPLLEHYSAAVGCTPSPRTCGLLTFRPL